MYRLSVVTPEKIIYEEDVASIIAPGTVGYLGILSNHAPIITSLKPGKLTVKDKDGTEIFFAVSGGFLERARESLERAKQRIRNAAGDIDLGRAHAAFERAKNRMRIVSK